MILTLSSIKDVSLCSGAARCRLANIALQHSDESVRAPIRRRIIALLAAWCSIKKRKEQLMTVLARMATPSIPLVAHPIEQCCYCWPTVHQSQPYPENWSSTCCTEHSTWLLAIAERRKQL